MTSIALLARGMQARKVKGSPARMAWSMQHTSTRWSLLQWSLVARRMQLRTINRKWRRVRGLSLAKA